MATKINAVIYARFSPRPNMQTCMSIEKQVAYCVDYCQRKGWRILQTFYDAGKTGANTNRPGLREALNLATSEQATLVVYDLSRMCRSQKDALDTLEKLGKAGANLASVSEVIDTTTPMGRAFFGFIAILNQLNRELVAQTTREAMLHMQSEGVRIGGRVRFGLKVDPNNPKRVIPCPEEEEAIREAKRLRKRGYTQKEIANRFNKQGIPCRNYDKWTTKRLITLVWNKLSEEEKVIK